MPRLLGKKCPRSKVCYSDLRVLCLSPPVNYSKDLDNTSMHLTFVSAFSSYVYLYHYHVIILLYIFYTLICPSIQ